VEMRSSVPAGGTRSFMLASDQLLRRSLSCKVDIEMAAEGSDSLPRI
jgi:hypothetical protein